MPLGVWTVSRRRGNDWTVLLAVGDGYDLPEGFSVPWDDSLCKHMVEGDAPRIAPSVDDVPAYSRAPLSTKLQIGAYLGVPLMDGEGSVFGTLAGFHSEPQPHSIAEHQPTLELLSSLLATVLIADTQRSEEARRAERAELDALSDPLTGLANRSAWAEALKSEEDRCKRMGHAACVVTMDIDGLKAVNDLEGHASGDSLLKKAAIALRKTSRGYDLVARLGGDEFGVLALHCEPEMAERLVERLRGALESQGVRASLGFAPRLPNQPLEEAARVADLAMYEDKRRRRSADGSGSVG